MRISSCALAVCAALSVGSVWAQHPTLNTGQAAPATPVPGATAQVTPIPGAATTLSVGAKLVNLPVVVRDNKGALAPNLTKADFTLRVDGKPREVRYFNVDRDLPLTLGLLVDTSQSQRGVIDEERVASQAFLDQMLTGAKDQAFILQFAREVELLQDVTGSKAKLQAALKELATPAPSGRDAGVVDPDDASDRDARRARGGTAFYDAVFLASDEVMRKQTGRKALILLTDGNDRSSKETLATAIETAQRGDTVVYAIYFKGEAPRQDRSLDDRDRYPGNGGGYPGGGYPGGGYPGGGYPGGGYPGGGRRQPEQLPNARNDGRKILDRMARETGGRMFEVTKKEPVGEIYAEIGRELRARYRLEYTPEADAAEDGYHKVELALNGADKKKWVVRTREGYYAGK